MEIKKVKLLKEGGLHVQYVNSVEENEIKLDSFSAPHPDLTSQFDLLRIVVAKVFRMGTMAEAEGELKQEMLSTFVMDKMKVFAIDYTDNGGVILHWYWLSENGIQTKLVTPCMKIASLAFGFEPMLEQIAERIKIEAKEYIKGKRAQLSLFGQDEGNE